MATKVFSGNGYLTPNVRAAAPRSSGQNPQVRVTKVAVEDLSQQRGGLWKGRLHVELNPQQGTFQNLALPAAVELGVELRSQADGSLAGRGVVPNPNAVDACGYQITISSPDAQGHRTLAVRVDNASWQDFAAAGGLGYRPGSHDVTVDRQSLAFEGVE